LIKTAVAQVVGWQGAALNVLRLGASPADLVVSAAVEMPVARKLRTAEALAELLFEIAPRHITMPFHVLIRDAIRDALVAQRRDQPVVQGRGISPVDRRA
jgi:hypothetical protein